MIETQTDRLTERYEALFQVYKDTPRRAILDAIEQAMLIGDREAALVLLNDLDSMEQLYERIFEFIKDKPVFKTLKKIKSGKASRYELLKGISSLFTHISIECEKGETQYEALLKDVYDVIGDKLYGS